MWTFSYAIPPGQRILEGNRNFIGIYVEEGEPSWWSYKHHKWVKDSTVLSDGGGCTHCHCSGLRAFKRHLRKHPELQSAGRVVLISRFGNEYDIIAQWRDVE